MKEKINKLESYGIHVEEAISRFFGDYELYMGLMVDFLQDESYMQLESAVLVKDYEMIKKAGHTLKGVAANLGFEELYKAAEKMLDLLNKDSSQEALHQYGEVRKAYDSVFGIIRDL